MKKTITRTLTLLNVLLLVIYALFFGYALYDIAAPAVNPDAAATPAEIKQVAFFCISFLLVFTVLFIAGLKLLKKHFKTGIFLLSLGTCVLLLLGTAFLSLYYLHETGCGCT
ncbi:MAG: hypothetical protein LBU87_06975 [Lactobacillales bacterium]|jgi:cell division protein FtsW (lipid II flippase)|nr:hypothetical protein [Lactobacillales bacterium]